MERSAQSRNHDVIVFVLGPPGSGKGTLCKLATNTLANPSESYQHFSVGDYLRELCVNGVPPCEAGGFDSNMISDSIRKNNLLPSEALIPLLAHKINSPKSESGWLIDGFPRNIETALAFDEKICKPLKVIVLECTRENAQSRYLSRAREPIDDEKRFAKRHGEYVANMDAIREYYGSAIETVCVDGDREESLARFISVLRRITPEPTNTD